MKIALALTESGAVDASASCTGCTASVVLFSFEIPPAVRTALGFMGFDFAEAIGSTDVPDDDGSITLCSTCADRYRRIGSE